ncbi:MAG: flavodoxin-dependent (E)-4-hydroxy-3-methylbut-2-enyl-diphosphate synthase, partial [Erysipelotrichaceae bacterium]|nr:flavodoxin-dependent (E)-4-hydroxy-3-methylbut-2-enyl-diphosphate synthase [Erysipelotrichaceae bacterium]
MTTRKNTRQIQVGHLTIGGQNACVIQSMTNTKTRDVKATVAQCHRLMAAGCEIVRFAVTCMEDAQAIAEIKKQVSCPIVADIHFDYKLA